MRYRLCLHGTWNQGGEIIINQGNAHINVESQSVIRSLKNEDQFSKPHKVFTGWIKRLKSGVCTKSSVGGFLHFFKDLEF